MFYSIKELVEQADKDFNGNIAELMISTETELSGRSRDEIIHIMKKNLQVMKNLGMLQQLLLMISGELELWLTMTLISLLMLIMLEIGNVTLQNCRTILATIKRSS